MQTTQMTVRDLITDLERFAAQAGDDARVILFDKDRDAELIVDPDNERYDFELTRGDNAVVIEF